MPTHQLMTLLIPIIALVVTVGAGTKKAPAKAPKEPIDNMLAEIRKGDPKASIVAGLQFHPGIPFAKATDDLQIIVNNDFHRAHYQERYHLIVSHARGSECLAAIGTPRLQSPACGAKRGCRCARQWLARPAPAAH